MYFPVQAKAALFLLASSFFGGFFVATKINQYMFDKTKEKKGGGQENERDGNDGKKRQGQVAQEDKEEKNGEEGDGQEEEEQGEDGEGDALNIGGQTRGRAAMRFLAGKSIRRNPGPYTPTYAYYVTRGFVGEGKAERFAVRAWFLRNGQLCNTDGWGVVECIDFKIVKGMPVEGGPDIELNPKQVKKIVEQAERKAKLARMKARQKAQKEAEAKGVPYTGPPPEPDDATLIETEDAAMRPPTLGEPVGLFIVDDKAFPIHKGNLLNFPPYIPTVDDPRLSKGSELAKDAPQEEKKPEPPKPVKPPPPKPVADRQAKGFAAPVAKPTAFDAPKISDRNQVKQDARQEPAPKPAAPAEPPVFGMEAWERILTKPMVPVGTVAAKVQPFLGYFDSEGRFLQLVRNPQAPYETIITTANWSWRDERICLVGLQDIPPGARPRPKRGQTSEPEEAQAREKVTTTCLIPSIAGEETNLINFRNQKLIVGTEELLNPLPPLTLEKYGPYRPPAFLNPHSQQVGGGVAALAAAASGKIAPLVSRQKGEGVTALVAKPRGEGVVPVVAKANAPGIAPVVSKTTGGEIAPVVSKPKGEGMAPVVSRQKGEGIAPVVTKPKGEGISPLAPRANGGKITPATGDDAGSNRARI